MEPWPSPAVRAREAGWRTLFPGSYGTMGVVVELENAIAAMRAVLEDDRDSFTVQARQVRLANRLERAELPRMRVHDLRHVFASHFVMGGGDIFTLQRILGHSTPQLTSDTYAHLSPRHLAGEADRVTYPEPAEAPRVLAFR